MWWGWEGSAPSPDWLIQLQAENWQNCKNKSAENWQNCKKLKLTNLSKVFKKWWLGWEEWVPSLLQVPDQDIEQLDYIPLFIFLLIYWNNSSLDSLTQVVWCFVIYSWQHTQNKIALIQVNSALLHWQLIYLCLLIAQLIFALKACSNLEVH